LKEQREKQRTMELEQEEVQRLEEAYKTQRELMNQRCTEKKEEKIRNKLRLLVQCRTHLEALGSDRFHNQYFWSKFSDGRIYILHSDTLYHRMQREDEEQPLSVTMESMQKLLSGDGMKMGNEWENMIGKEEEREHFCWSMISTTSQLHKCMDMLDERGVREKKLVFRLRALKKDIVQWMKWNGNDDYVEADKMEMDDDDDDESTDDGSRGRRRSTRRRDTSGGKEGGMGYIEQLQSSDKDFMSWKNKVKRR